MIANNDANAEFEAIKIEAIEFICKPVIINLENAGKKPVQIQVTT